MTTRDDASRTIAITCPSCGETSSLVVNDEGTPERAADAFCPKCDYPLFWARAEGVAAPHPVDETGRRLPATEGRLDVPAVVCWNCHEPNAVGQDRCWRCGVDLSGPPPVIAPQPAPPAEPPPPPAVMEPPRPRLRWPWILIGVLAAIAVIALVLLLILG